ncbi:MAG: hypothetical protein KDA79_22185 [Planctomycetaceae bacterium]|nr:hypothetical protein [Planctomycetaceae bacterium]
MKYIAAVLIAAGTTFTTTDAKAADPHLRELADALASQSSHAVREVRYHFRRAPGADQMYRTAVDIAELADHISEISQGRVDISHLKEDVDQLDSLIHELEELTEAASRPVVIEGNRSRYYHRGYHRHTASFVSEYHVRRLTRLIEEMEDTVHHLAEDLDDIIGVRPVPRPVPRTITPVAPGFNNGPVLVPPAVRRPVYRNDSSGIQIRRDNGRVVFSLRFR